MTLTSSARAASSIGAAVPINRPATVFRDSQPGPLDSRFRISDSNRTLVVGSSDFRPLQQPGTFELALMKGNDRALLVRFERNAFSVLQQTSRGNSLFQEPPRPMTREEKLDLRDLLARSGTKYRLALKALDADLRRKPIVEPRQFGSASKTQTVTASSIDVFGPSVPRRDENDHFRNARVSVTIRNAPGEPRKATAIRVVNEAGVVVATIKGSELAQDTRNGLTQLTSPRLPTGLFADGRHRIVIDFGKGTTSLQGELRGLAKWSTAR